MNRKLILRYNPLTGNNYMAWIKPLVQELDLTIASSERVKDGSGVVVITIITGEADQIAEMNKRLVAHASIERKVA